MSCLNLEVVRKELKKNGLALREHQIEGINKIIEWYDVGHGGILADEMGLGKTCQSIIAVSILMSRTNKSPCLVICPLSVMEHWTNEIERFSCGAMKVFQYYETRVNRAKMRRKLKSSDWNVILTTYETFLNDFKWLHYTWEFVIFDESQRVKCFDSLLTKALRQCNINWMVSMTGTPVQNNMSELFSLLNLVDNKMFPDDGGEAFVEKYGLSKEEKDYFLKQTNNKHTANQSLMNVLMQLRKTVDHPYLFKGFEKEPYEDGEHLRDASGKVLILERLLKYLFEKKHKVLIFSQFVRFLNIIHDYLLFKGYNVVQLDGGMKLDERQEAVGSFQSKNSDVFAFLLSTRAGGVGLNLMAADTVIFVDWDMNPQMDKQAAARCHRIGQVKPVKIIRLLAKHTVDEIIESRVSHKLLLSHYVMGNDDDVVHSKVDLLTQLLLKGLKELEEDDDATIANVSAITNEQLEGIIGKTLRNGNWDIKKNTSEAGDDFEEESDEAVDLQNCLDRKAIYQYKGHDYAEDRMILEKIAQSLACGIKIDTNGNVVVEETSETRSTSRRKNIMSDEEREQLIAEMKERAEKKKILQLEKKAQMWLDNDYHSLSLAKVDIAPPSNVASKNGRIYSVQGNVAKPVIFRQGDNNLAIILHCSCNNGVLPYYGLANSLRQLSAKIPDALSTAKQMKDIHMGDCHLVKLYDDTLLTAKVEPKILSENNLIGQSFDENAQIEGKENVVESSNSTNMALNDDNELKFNNLPADIKSDINSLGLNEKSQQSLNLAVGLLISHKTKSASSNITQLSLYSLENALCRVGKFAAEHNASVHMSQIWFNQKVKESEVRYILRKTLCNRFGVDVYIYHFKKENKARSMNRAKALATVDSMDSVTCNQQNTDSLNIANFNRFGLTSIVGDSVITVDESKCAVVRDTKALDKKYNGDSDFSDELESLESDNDDFEDNEMDNEVDVLEVKVKKAKKMEKLCKRPMINAESSTVSDISSSTSSIVVIDEVNVVEAKKVRFEE